MPVRSIHRARRKPLKGRVALVAGATRGAGRGIACMLGEAGATVYCSGRSTRQHPATGVYAGRPETIEETADLVTAGGGAGIPVRTDHLDESQVAALCARIDKEQGRLDVLVNDISEGERYDWQPFWRLNPEQGLRALRSGVHSHIITARHAVPIMVAHRRGLIVEIGDGDRFYYRGHLFYDLVKTSTSRLAWAMAQELHDHRVAAVAVTPGFMRTEMLLDELGVTEENWRSVAVKTPNLEHSETPFYVGRAVAALAGDRKVLDKSGGLYTSAGLAREYGFTDVDGARPNVWPHVRAAVPAAKTAVEWRLGRTS